MFLGVIADDFTGASDIANEISRGIEGEDGFATAIYVGTPDHDCSKPVDAGVVALKSRSVPSADAIRESLHALDWLLSQGATQIVFKYCSTFDSTIAGNIGPVGEALAKRLGERGVIACPAFPANGRTVYQGHLFVHDKLLNESGLENHPINPMTDSDIRRWLAAQSESPVGHLPLSTTRSGVDAVKKALQASAEAGDVLVITDATSSDDLVTLAKAVEHARLVTGGSAIAAALPGNFPVADRCKMSVRDFTPIDGHGVVLAGSCSSTTRVQIEQYSADHPSIPIDVAAVVEGRIQANQLFDSLDEHQGEAPVAYSSGNPDQVRALQERYGSEKIAESLDKLFGQTAILLRANGYTRIVVAGGETSGAVVDALAPNELSVGVEIDPGVPALFSSARGTKYGIALKSGNFGAPDFFEKALRALAGT